MREDYGHSHRTELCESASETMQKLKEIQNALSFHDALRVAERFLEQCHVADAATDAWLLLECVTGMTRTRFLLDRNFEMPEEARKKYIELLEKRGNHIPLQHLTGVQEFMGFTFQVNEHVLIPRQDTEILVEEAQKRIRPGMRILDLCTGSGCIGISLAKLWPGGIRKYDNEDQNPLAIAVDCADISQEALKVARRNSENLNTDVRIWHSDLFELLDADEIREADVSGIQNYRLGRYDMIVSNPPYIQTSVIAELSEEVRMHEPFGALDGKEDGLYFYRKIILESGDHLVNGGWLLFEIGYDQGEAVSDLMKAQGFADVQVKKDLAGLDRVVCGRLEKN